MRQVFAVLLVLVAASAAAQTPPFVVQSDDGDNRLQLGALVQADARFAIDDTQDNVVDTFTLRRLRAIAQGRVARHFDFYVNMEFAGAGFNVRDAYFDTTFAPAFHVRAGKFKAPFSYARLILAANTLLGERGFTTTVAPDRDIGVQALGDLAGARVSYAVSLTNGVIDGGSSDGDINDAKDVTARVVARPLSGLAVAMAVNSGTHGPALPSFVSVGRQMFFSYAPGTAESGRRTRWSPQASYYRGPLGAYAEYVRSRAAVAKDGADGDIDHDAWQVLGSWVLTGEMSTERAVRPRENFDPPSGHYGALQAVARVERFAVSPETISRGLAAPGASRTADAWTAGLNWYLNPFIRWHVEFTRTIFDGDAGGPRHAENLLLARAQMGF